MAFLQQKEETTDSQPFPYRVQVLDRTLAILDVLSGYHHGATVPQICSHLQLNKTTVYRLLMVLGQHGVVEKSTGTQRYRLGTRLCEYGLKAAEAERSNP